MPLRLRDLEVPSIAPQAIPAMPVKPKVRDPMLQVHLYYDQEHFNNHPYYRIEEIATALNEANLRKFKQLHQIDETYVYPLDYLRFIEKLKELDTKA